MTDKTKMTELEIIEDLQQHLHKDDKLYLARMEKADLGILHHFFGRQIRNNYGLWQDNPITETWRTDESSHKIIDGIDHSEDHPDAVSMRIIEKLWLRLRRVAELKGDL